MCLNQRIFESGLSWNWIDFDQLSFYSTVLLIRLEILCLSTETSDRETLISDFHTSNRWHISWYYLKHDFWFSNPNPLLCKDSFGSLISIFCFFSVFNYNYIACGASRPFQCVWFMPICSWSFSNCYQLVFPVLPIPDLNRMNFFYFRWWVSIQ